MESQSDEAILKDGIDYLFYYGVGGFELYDEEEKIYMAEIEDFKVCIHPTACKIYREAGVTVSVYSNKHHWYKLRPIISVNLNEILELPMSVRRSTFETISRIVRKDSE